MNRLVVLLDSGMLKYSTRFVARNRFGISHDAPLSELAQHPQIDAMTYDILAATLRGRLAPIESNWAKIDRCIVCLDVGDSWRTEIDRVIIPGTNIAARSAYKGHRRTEDEEELKAIMRLNAAYKKAINFICDNSGIEQVGSASLEADDFMILLGQQYAKQGDTVIIIAKDADITQAVCHFDNGGKVIIMQTMKDKSLHMIVDHATHDDASKASIFDMSSANLGLKAAIRDAEVLAPQYMLLTKVMNGDASDDISPVMQRVVNDRHYKLTAKNLGAIFDHFVAKNACGYFTIENMYTDSDIYDILAVAHMQMFKSNFYDLPLEWRDFYYAKFCENRKLVCVNEQELGAERFASVFRAAAEQLRGLTPVIAFPDYRTLQQLSL